MKKAYVSPRTVATVIETTALMAASGVNGNNGIGFGGRDEDGTVEPTQTRGTIGSRRSQTDIWDDEEVED